VFRGGSVTPANVKGFLTMPDIDGVLPGTSSLDPLTFWNIITNAA
jgi:triosephosphate isomerase